MPTAQRATSSLFLREGSAALALDAGTGIATLCRKPELLAGVDRLAVVLSHFHLDHVAGLAYLPAVADRLEITVWGPGTLLGASDSLSILSALVGPPFLSVELSTFARVVEISAGENEVSSWVVDARVQPFHPGRSVGFRLGDDLAYCTDTAPDPDCAAFVRGVGTLVHEAWAATAPTADHSSAASAAQTAAAGETGRLVLSHINPVTGDTDTLLRAARPIFENTEVGYDGLDIH